MTSESPGAPKAESHESAISDGAAGVESALQSLATRDPALARQLAALFTAVVAEAAKSGRFAHTMSAALASAEADPEDAPRRVSHTSTRRSAPAGTRPKNRRLAGVVDPFVVYAESGEPELRKRLSDLNLERLRDIVAEHGMDNDRLAMKWKDPGRVIDRIVDRVVARSAKGSAFRGDRPDARPSTSAWSRAAEETSTSDAPTGATESDSAE